MNFKYSIIIGICFFIIFPVIVKAQNNSSPYSIIGIGNVENSYFNRYTGMANAGVALSDGRYINISNPASLAALNTHTFAFEVSLRSTIDIYSGGDIQEPSTATFDASFRRLSVATKITKRWGSSMGLQPYSTAAYNYTAVRSIDGTLADTITAAYEGTGGVNQFYWANGYQLTKNTSIGLTTSLLFGSLKQTESLIGSEVPAGLVTINNIYLTGLYFNLGLQTKLRLNKTWESSYGITFSPQTALHSTNSINVTDVAGDTLNQQVPIYSDFNIPSVVNVGIAFIKNKKYTFTLNAKEQSWGNINYRGTDYQLVNSNKFSLGYQVSNKVKNFYGQEYEKSFFQLGIYGGDSYLKVYNQQITDFGASIGYGVNAKRAPIGYCFALEAGRRGSTNSIILSENYINFNLTLSYIDRWYKGKKYY